MPLESYLESSNISWLALCPWIKIVHTFSHFSLFLSDIMIMSKGNKENKVDEQTFQNLNYIYIKIKEIYININNRLTTQKLWLQITRRIWQLWSEPLENCHFDCQKIAQNFNFFEKNENFW